MPRRHRQFKCATVAHLCFLTLAPPDSPYGKIIDGIVKSEEGRDDLAIAKLSEVIDGCSLEEAGSVLLANAYFEVRPRTSPVLESVCYQRVHNAPPQRGELP